MSLSRYAKMVAQISLTCKSFPASTGDSKFLLPAKGGTIEQRYCRGEKRFSTEVLKLDKPPAEKALLLLK